MKPLSVSRFVPHGRRLLAALFLASVPCLRADVACARIFGDHMVLQRDQAVPVWGTGAPGETVKVSFAGQSVSTRVDPSGSWSVRLDPMPASDVSRDFTVAGTNQIRFSDVVVGEVWLCSGQSNMEKPVGLRPGQKPTDGYVEEIRKAASRAAGLTRQLLLFSRQQVVEPKVIDLHDVLTRPLPGLVTVAGVVAWRGRPVWLWRALGNVAAVVGLLGAAARSANTQRAYPNINLFIIAAVITALFLRVQPQVFVPTLLAGTAMVLGGTVHFRQGGTARLADELVLIAVSSVAVVGFFGALPFAFRASGILTLDRNCVLPPLMSSP